MLSRSKKGSYASEPRSRFKKSKPGIGDTGMVLTERLALSLLVSELLQGLCYSQATDKLERDNRRQRRLS